MKTQQERNTNSETEIEFMIPKNKQEDEKENKQEEEHENVRESQSKNIRRSERSNKGIPPLRLGLYAGAATSNQSESNTRGTIGCKQTLIGNRYLTTNICL